MISVCQRLLSLHVCVSQVHVLSPSTQRGTVGVGLSGAPLGVGLSRRIWAPDEALRRSLPAPTRWVHSGKQLS